MTSRRPGPGCQSVARHGPVPAARESDRYGDSAGAGLPADLEYMIRVAVTSYSRVK